MTFRNCLAGAVALSLIAGGCGKKRTEEAVDKDFVDAAQTREEESDVFDEFYEEDTSAGEAAMVEEETFSTSPGSYTPRFADNGAYVVQVSCVASSGFAQKKAEELQAAGYPAYVAEVQDPAPQLPGTYYRVRIGSFNTVTAAREFAENRLVPSGYEFWVDNQANDHVGMEGYGLGSGGDAGAYGDFGATEPAATGEAASSSASTDAGFESAAQPAPAATYPETESAPAGDGYSEEPEYEPVESAASTPPPPAEPPPSPAPEDAAAAPAPDESGAATGESSGRTQESGWEESGWGEDEWDDAEW
jgi:hypothetical protein